MPRGNVVAKNGDFISRPLVRPRRMRDPYMLVVRDG